MANPIEQTRTSSSPEAAKIEPTRNDPTPELRKGDSRFLPVVVLAGIALIVLLIAGVLLVRSKGHKLVPAAKGDHPTSSLVLRIPDAA
jgi:hypothetical protein